MKGLRRNQLHLNVVFILLSYCWGGRWLGQTHAKILQDETFGNSDDRIGNISVSHRLSLPHVIVDECTDFYGHVCRGHSILHNSFLEVLDQESWRNRLHTRLEALISAEVWPDDEPAVKKVKRQYELCMDFDKRDQFASDSLRLLLGNTSSFPMIMGSSQWDPQTLQILEPQKYDSSLFSIRVRDGKILVSQSRYEINNGIWRFVRSDANLCPLGRLVESSHVIKTSLEPHKEQFILKIIRQNHTREMNLIMTIEIITLYFLRTPKSPKSIELKSFGNLPHTHGSLHHNEGYSTATI